MLRITMILKKSNYGKYLMGILIELSCEFEYEKEQNNFKYTLRVTKWLATF